MQIDVYEHGVFSWVDVTSKDLEAGRKFYADLFGWQVEPGAEEFGGYSMAVLNGRMVAGISPAMFPEVPPAWSTYVDVANLEETLAKVTSSGGHTIAGPMDVGDSGRMAVFSDPEGGVIGLWQAKAHKGAGLVNEANTWSWNELMCDDPDKEKAFYGAVFGWGEITHGEGDGAYTEWQLGGRSIGGMMKKPPGTPPGMPTMWTVYFSVDDIEATTKKLQSLGGSVLRPPTEIEPGIFAVVADPGGAVFSLLQPKS